MPTVKLTIKQHDGTERLFAAFEYNKELNEAVRQIPGARWSKSNKAWHFAVNRDVVKQLREKLKGLAVIDTAELKLQLQERKEVRLDKRLVSSGSGQEAVAVGSMLKPMPINTTQTVALKAYIELLRLKNYSHNTIKTYSNWFIIFLNYFPEQNPDRFIFLLANG